MKNRIIYGAVLGLLTLASCGKPLPEHSATQAAREAMRLSGGGTAIAVPTTRADAFPNATIGVIAALYDQADSAASADWTTYTDINNALAHAGGADANGVYSFTWDEGPKYWPFDTTKLVFMAYSPHTDNFQSNVLLDDRNKILDISLREDMQDVMYASGNTVYAPFDKRDGTVALGEFRHALSRLTVEVVSDTNMSPDILLTGLRVSTNTVHGQLDLTLGDEGLTVSPPAESGLTYALVETPTAFNGGEAKKVVRDVLLFPGTEDDVRIEIQLAQGGSVGFQHTYMIADFPDIDTHQALTLQRGKNTVVRFRVSSVNVNPSELELQGRLVGWTEGGKLSSTIE